MADLHQQVTDLETEITSLCDAMERLRKRMIVAKLSIAAGILLFVVALSRLILFDPMLLVVGIAATLAGTGFSVRAGPPWNKLRKR